MMLKGLILLFAGVGAIMLATGIGILASLEYAWVTTKLWAWFVVPVFALPILSTWQVFGIALIVGLYKQTIERDLKNEERAKTITRFVLTFVNPLFVLLVGYLVHTYLLR